MRKLNLSLVFLILICSVLLTSCGVIFGGSKYNAIITVKDHPNAEIYVNGEKIGTGEAKGQFYREDPLQVEVKQEGCEPKIDNFNNTFRTGNFILSFLTFSVIGLGVDLGTGAAYKPDHRGDKNIERLSDKSYIFTVDYEECKKP